MTLEDITRRAEELLPKPDQSSLVVGPPEHGHGHWAGAPSAARGANGEIYLAYRLRRPLGEGRGYAVVVARSDGGEQFETLVTIGKEQMDAESLERPALVRTPGGAWRLYLSCATYGTKHWRVEVIEAGHPAAFDPRRSHVTLPGDAKTGVKDPVILHRAGAWHLWASCHPLEDPKEADQMVTDYATSLDGRQWTWHGTALSGRPGQWDGRGTRITSVRFDAGMTIAYYDGRASAAENYEERTGAAIGTEPTALTAFGRTPLAQAPNGGGLRYLTVLPLPDGSHRLYYEMTRDGGTHELRTELRPAAAGG